MWGSKLLPKPNNVILTYKEKFYLVHAIIGPCQKGICLVCYPGFQYFWELLSLLVSVHKLVDALFYGLGPKSVLNADPSLVRNCIEVPY
jgi:hypothetical protein